MRNILLVLILGLTSLVAEAGDEKWDEINEWGGVGFSQVYVAYPDKSTRSFQAVIADDPDGKQVVEFRFMDSKHDKCALLGDARLNDVVLRINGKRVKMKAGCKRVAIMNVLRYFATSKEGRSFIVEAFKLEAPVPVALQGYDIRFPAKGFTKAWESYGGDAM